MSNYVISVKRVDGGEVKLRPGAVAERQLVAEVLQQIEGQSVGFFRTKAQVLSVVEKAMQDVLYALKSDVVP